MIRMDPDVDSLIEGNVRTWCKGNRGGKAPVSRKKRREKEASHPAKILKQWHGQRASAPVGRLQFAAAGLAEIAQRIHLVDQVGQVDECPVWRQISI